MDPESYSPFARSTTLSLTLISEPDLQEKESDVLTSGVFISAGIGGFMGLIFEAASWVRPSNSRDTCLELMRTLGYYERHEVLRGLGRESQVS
jgi:hypothetical protein